MAHELYATMAGQQMSMSQQPHETKGNGQHTLSARQPGSDWDWQLLFSHIMC